MTKQARTNAQSPAPPAQSADLVKLQPAGALAVPDYLKSVRSDAGFEDVTREDLVLPRLSICQALTPQRQKQNTDKYIPGLEEGMFFNTITGQIYGNEVRGVPLMMKKAPRIYFKPKNEGGGVLCQSFDGIKGGRLSPTCAECPNKDWEGAKPPKCTQFDSFPLVLLPSLELIVFALKSTGIKIARQWITRMKSPPFVGKPMYSGIYNFKAVGMQSDGRPFFGPVISLVPFTDPVYTEDVFRYAEQTYQGLSGKTIKIDDTEHDESGAEETEKTPF